MRSGKVILVSHCILNQNAVISGWARAKGAFPVVKQLVDAGVGIIQLPCPELIFKGLCRPPLTYEGYNTEEYRTLCRDLLVPYWKQITGYLENGYSLLGVIGIHNSPTCSVTGQRGVFMEELFALCEKQGIPLAFAEVPEEYSESSAGDALTGELAKLIEESQT